MENTPHDILRLVANFSDAEHIAAMAQVCNGWKWINNDERIWLDCSKRLRPFDFDSRLHAQDPKRDVRGLIQRRKAVYSKRLIIKNLHDFYMSLHSSIDDLGFTNHKGLHYMPYEIRDNDSDYRTLTPYEVTVDIKKENVQIYSKNLGWRGTYQNPMVYLTDEFALLHQFEEGNPKWLKVPIDRYMANVNAGNDNTCYEQELRNAPDANRHAVCRTIYTNVEGTLPYIAFGDNGAVTCILNKNDLSVVVVDRDKLPKSVVAFYKDTFVIMNSTQIRMMDAKSLEVTRVLDKLEDPNGDDLHYTWAVVKYDKIFAAVARGDNKMHHVAVHDWHTGLRVEKYKINPKVGAWQRFEVDGTMMYGAASSTQTPLNSEALFYDMEQRKVVHKMKFYGKEIVSVKLHDNDLVIATRRNLIKIILDYEALQKTIQVAIVPVDLTANPVVIKRVKACSIIDVAIQAGVQLNADTKSFVMKYSYHTKDYRVVLFHDGRDNARNPLANKSTNVTVVHDHYRYLPYHPYANDGQDVYIVTPYMSNNYGVNGTTIIFGEEWNEQTGQYELADFNVERDAETTKFFVGLSPDLKFKYE